MTIRKNLPPRLQAVLQRLQAKAACHRRPPALLAVLADRRRHRTAVQGMRRPAMVLRMVHGLPPPDAPAAVGATLVPVLFRLGSAGRAVLLGMLGLQPQVPGRDMRGLRP